MDPYGMYGSPYPEHIIYYPNKQASPAFTINGRTSMPSGYSPNAHASPSAGYPPVPAHRNASVYLPPPASGERSVAVPLKFSSDTVQAHQSGISTDFYNYDRLQSTAPQMVYAADPMRYNDPKTAAAFSPPEFTYDAQGFRVQSNFSRGSRGGFGNRPFGRGKPRRMGLTQPESGGAGLGTPRVYVCSLCNVSCGGSKVYADHQAGRIHKKRAAQLAAVEALEKSGQTTVKLSSDSKGRELYCELCKIACSGAEAFTAHLNGKLHKKALNLLDKLGSSALGLPATTTPTTLTAATKTTGPAVQSDKPPSTVETAKPPVVKEAPIPTKSVVNESSQDSSAPKAEEKLLGEEYVEPIPAVGGKGVHYRCKLCECQFTNLESKEVHLRGRRHRLQYKKKVDPSLVVESKSYGAGLRKAAAARGASSIPPMPKADSLPRSALHCLMTDRNAYGPVPRFVYRNHGPVTFTSMPPHHYQITLENRHVIVKHATLVPTEMEVQAMRSAVGICEHALKNISDDLLESDCATKTSSEDSTSSVDPSKGESDATKDTSETNEETKTSETEMPKDNPSHTTFPVTTVDRLFCGVVRVGALGKSLLLRGDHVAELVLVCAEWPTTEVVRYLKTELTKRLTEMAPKFSHELKSDLSSGLIIIQVKKSNATEQEKDTGDWPIITIHLRLTSYQARKTEQGDLSTSTAGSVDVVESGGSVMPDEHVNNATSAAANKTTTATSALQPTNPVVEQPTMGQEHPKPPKGRSAGHKMFTLGVRVALPHCLQAQEAIDQAKWFQAALTKPPLGMVSRVLVDFMRYNDDWQELDQFALLAFLNHLLTMDLQSMGPPMMGFVPALSPPFGGPNLPRGPTRPQPLIGPGRLLRQFFEAIASGLLLHLPTSKQSYTKADSVELPPPPFFAFALLATAPLETRESITVSAQYFLRQVAFKQLHKVLRMEAITPVPSRNRRANDKKQSTDATNEKTDDEVAETDESFTSTFSVPDEDIGGTSKRRRLDEGEAGQAVAADSPVAVDTVQTPVSEQIAVDEPVVTSETANTTTTTSVTPPPARTRSTTKRTRNS